MPAGRSGGGVDPKGGYMKRATLLALAATFVLSAAPAPAGASDRVSVRVPSNDAPRPPRARQSRVKLVLGTGVYVVTDPIDHDVFRYAGYWYLFSNGYWFRARSYSGAFARWDARRIPRAVMNVPASYWRHPAPAPTSIARRD